MTDTGFKRVNAKKIKLVYIDPLQKLEAENVQKVAALKGKIKLFSFEQNEGISTAYLEFEDKINITVENSFQLLIQGIMVIPKISSYTKSTSTKEVLTTKQVRVLNQVESLKIVIKALTDREDVEFQNILKEDPFYPVLEKLNLSVYHIISIILHGIYVESQFQDIKLDTIQKKIYQLKYLNYDSEETLIKSVLELNPAKTRNLLNIFRGIE